MQFFGKDMTFYNLLEAQAEAAHRAARAFHALAGDFSRLDAAAREVEEIEHEADQMTHQLFNKVDATFVTPMDKEDLNALSSALDDITDFIEAAVARLVLYRLTTPRPDLEPLVLLLVQVTEVTREAVAALRHIHDRDALHPTLVRIHEIENASDRSFRQALADLFNAPNPDPLMVIKWKEIYDRIEMSVDKCESVANILESVAVKYA